MKKTFLIILTTFMLFVTNVFASDFSWAEDAVNYCVDNEILHGMDDGQLHLGDNITNEQTAKILVSTFLPEKVEISTDEETELDLDRWSTRYVLVFNSYTKKVLNVDILEEKTTREEFVSALVLASGLKEGNIRNRDILSENFNDYKDVGDTYQKLMCIAVERGYMKGSDGYLYPKNNITRAEACSLIYRVIRATKNGEVLDLGVKESYTEMLSESKVSVEQAKQWAKNRGASQGFIDGADLYWKYGEITGICPEILYAQSAKETKFGLYGGAVIPEQNNWAGIKTKTATGDRMEDHETFETPEDGVRGHFNHMSAYVGTEIVGEPHGRYFSVSKMKWAGTVKTLEELGGKWCPDLYYGYSILHNFLEPMMNTEVEDF